MQQEQDDEFRRLEDSLTVFRNFARTLSMAILGTQSDKLIMRLNKFAMNIYNVRTALIENNFPFTIASLLYIPIVFVVLFLNCLRMQIIWWIATITILAVFCFLFAALLSMFFVCLKGFMVYQARGFEEAEMQEQESQQQE